MATEPELEAKYAHNNKVMVASAILLLLLILIIILFRIHLYLCRRRHRLFSQQPPLPTTIKEEEEQRLDPSILKSLPTFTYSSAATRPPLHECAVCLSEFADGDEGRTLPNCSHSFHSHCIDTWFASHSTCPLCRAPVRPETVSSHTESCAVVSVSEAGEGCSSYFPPRKPLRIIVELPEARNGSDHVPGEHGFRCSLKRLCNV